MRRWIVGLCYVVAAAFSPPALAQLAPQPGFPQDRYKDFTPDPAVVYGTLPNGLRYAIQKWPTPKGEASIRLRIAAGSYMERNEQAGLMHFLEHMAFNGSENVPESEFDKMMSREGLAFGPDTNAYTSWDETVYQLDMPKSERLGLGLKLMRETAGRLTLDAGAIDRERGIIMSEERARNSPSERVFRAFARHALAGTEVLPRFPIGDMKVIREAKRELFVDLYKRFYSPERALLAVVGDFDPAVVEAEIKKQFSDWAAPTQPARDPDLGKLQSVPGKVSLFVEPQSASSVQLFVTKPYVATPDTSDQSRKQLLLSLAERILNTRLERIARREGSPITGAQITSGDVLKAARLSAIEASLAEPTHWSQALDIIDLELRRALAHGFTAQEFATAIADVQQSYQDGVTQSGARRSAQIVGAILSAFGDDSVYTSSEVRLAWFNKILPSLSAAAALAELQAEWGKETPQMFVTAGSAIAGGEAALIKAYEVARARPVPAPIVETVTPWPYSDFGAIGQVVATKPIKALGVTSYRFANQVHLNVKPTKFEDGRVRVQVRFGEGGLSFQTKANPGTPFAIDSAFIAGGLGKLDVDEINRTLAGKSVNVGLSTTQDAFVLGATTTPRDLELQLQYLAAYLTDPAWRPDGLARLKASKDAIYRSIDSTPGSVWGTQGQTVLRSDARAPRFPTPAEFDAMSLDEARALLDPARKSGAIEVTIVGDTNLDAAKAAVAKTFGALPVRARAPSNLPEARIAVFPKGRGTNVLTHKGREDQSLAMVFWPMRDYGDGKEARALRILESVLQNRLTEVVREELSDSYSPRTEWAPSDVFPNYGVIGAMSEVKPEKADLIIATMERIAADLAAGKIDADLFERAKRPLVADFEETTANNPWWLAALGNISFDPKRVVRARDGKKQYESVTLDQVKALAKRYFDPSKARLVKILPGPEATKVTPEPEPATKADTDKK